jgi:hypothetical protein
MTSVFFSCEHATCAVPEPWRELFRGHEEIVSSSEGWEPGALNLAQGFAIRFRTPLSHGDVTRLLIDLEAEGDAQWSRFSSQLTDVQKGKLRDRHQRTFQNSAHHNVAEALRREPFVVQVVVRVEDLGEGIVSIESMEGDETAGRIAGAWAAELKGGIDRMEADSVIVPSVSAIGRFLRQAFGDDRVAVITLRVSRSYFLDGRPWRWEKAKKRLIDSLASTLNGLTPAPECSSSAGD